MTMRNEFYVIGAAYPVGPFRSRAKAEREMRFLLEDLRADQPDAPADDDFGVYIQHRQF